MPRYAVVQACAELRLCPERQSHQTSCCFAVAWHQLLPPPCRFWVQNPTPLGCALKDTVLIAMTILRVELCGICNWVVLCNNTAYVVMPTLCAELCSMCISLGVKGVADALMPK